MAASTRHRGAVRSGARSKPARGEARAVSRIAVGVDGYASGRDAAALAAAIAGITGAEVVLVGVHPDPLAFPLAGLDWNALRRDERRVLNGVRATFFPEARVATEADFSIPRALQRVTSQEHCDLLAIGSSRHADLGHVRIGKRARELLYQSECAVAVAPRGLHDQPAVPLRRIGVGCDGHPGSEAALRVGAAMASNAGTALLVHGVVDDRLPLLVRSPVTGLLAEAWEQTIAEEEQRLQQRIQAQADALGANAKVEVSRGRPADALLAFSKEVDLIVLGSRRWGPVQRVLLGSTGEALLHDAACPVLTVPRPAA